MILAAIRPAKKSVNGAGVGVYNAVSNTDQMCTLGRGYQTASLPGYSTKMQLVRNTRRGTGLPELWDGNPVWPSVDGDRVARFLKRCPVAEPTPLVAAAGISSLCGVAEILLKDERNRMNLGSFKALGAAYVISCDAEAAMGNGGNDSADAPLAGTVYVTASAGNHGLSVAAGARVFGAKSIVYLANSVPESFAGRLRSEGAEVRREGDTYEASMEAAMKAAARGGWTLLSDSSWPGYHEIPRLLMEGYLQMMTEIAGQLETAPTHIFLQAGVGGMAAAVAASARRLWGSKPVIVVVEPDAAPALAESIRAGRVVQVSGPVSSMGRLDCKLPSLLALSALARDADVFATISETEAAEGTATLAAHGFGTTPSGGAGVAAILASHRHRREIAATRQSRVLAFLTEGPETP